MFRIWGVYYGETGDGGRLALLHSASAAAEVQSALTVNYCVGRTNCHSCPLLTQRHVALCTHPPHQNNECVCKFKATHSVCRCFTYRGMRVEFNTIKFFLCYILINTFHIPLMSWKMFYKTAAGGTVCILQFQTIDQYISFNETPDNINTFRNKIKKKTNSKCSSRY
jgi:hypothetical protein